MPAHVDQTDVLFELRQFSWEWRKWRSEVNGDLAFLARLRDVVNDTIRAVVIVTPILGVAAALYVAFVR